MMIQTNTTDRKALVKAIAEELHTDYRYLRTPTYAYEVGDFTVDRYGNIIGEDFAPLMSFLLRHGYINEDALAAQTEDAEVSVAENAETEQTDVAAPEAADEDASAEPEEPTEVQAETPDEDTAENADAPDKDANTESEEPTEETHSEEAQQPAEDNGTNIDTQTITIPAPGITVEQLRNLVYILFSRQYILNLMTGSESIAIPLELVEALKQARPATSEDFTALLDSHKEHGLLGFDFRDGQFTLTFPFYESEPTKWTTFAGLQGRILQAAMAAKRVFPELLKPDEEAEKYTAHIWLQRMGYKGPEMKEQRNILLDHLHGYCAFSNGAKMQNHKDKYSAIRRERREAERAAAQALTENIAPTTTATETIAPATTEAKPSVVAPEKEVASNE